MPAKSETFLLKFTFDNPEEETPNEREGVKITYPDDIVGFSDILTATSDPVRGDGYYGRADGFHTVQYNLSGFIGNIHVQATLTVDPQESDWFTVYSASYDLQSTPGVSENANKLTNFTGNYVWIRIRIDDWSGGSVESVYLNH